MICNFHVGQRVICIDDDWERLSLIFYPVSGSVYTVRAILPDDEGGSLLLEELVNAEHVFSEGLFEPDFDATMFRAVVTRPTSIEIFTKILNTTRIGVDA